MDKKKNKYKGVISPPIKDALLKGYGLGKAGILALPKTGGLKKQPMGPPKSLMQPRFEIRSKPMYDAKVTKKLVKPSKPRYGAGGTDNPRKPRYGAGGTNNPKVKKKKPKSEAQKRYEEQIKARKKRQKKDPLGRD